MKKLTILLSIIMIFAFMVAGCAPTMQQQERYAIFNEADFAPYLQKGTGKIVGQAFLKTRGGTVKYGAGNPVELMPINPYTEEIYLNLAGNNQNMEPPDSRYYKYVRTVTADGSGNFEFTELPAGKYYLTCIITWEVGGSRYARSTGGVAIGKVFLKDGETAKVIVTR